MMGWSGVVGNVFRGWFTIDDGTGAPKTGLVAGNFTATIVVADDSASWSPTVTESSQVSGLYYFDVPGSFLTTYGAGSYGLMIVVNSGPPPFKAIASSVLRVTQQDIDTLAGDVWEEATADHVTVGTFGAALGTVLDYSEGRWKIESNQMKFYKSDNSTLIATFNLLDSGGNPTVDAVFERRKV